MERIVGMGEKQSYFDLLKHPNWQRKRLKVLERAGFQCEDCGSAEVTLHVHHSYYEKGLAPWEYPDESLHCLCENCHRKAQDRQLLLQRQLGKIELGDIDTLYGYALALESANFPMVPLDVYSYEVAMGIGHYWGLSADEVIQALEESTIDGYKLDALARAQRGAGEPLRKEPSGE